MLRAASRPAKRRANRRPVERETYPRRMRKIMAIKCEEYSQVCVMEVQGDFLAEAAAGRQESHGRPRRAAADRRFRDRLQEMRHSSTATAWKALLWMKRRCEDLFGRIKLVNLDENCKKILEITRLEHRFECQAIWRRR
jgi:hypothetical protein